MVDPLQANCSRKVMAADSHAGMTAAVCRLSSAAENVYWARRKLFLPSGIRGRLIYRPARCPRAQRVGGSPAGTSGVEKRTIHFQLACRLQRFFAFLGGDNFCTDFRSIFHCGFSCQSHPHQVRIPDPEGLLFCGCQSEWRLATSFAVSSWFVAWRLSKMALLPHGVA